MASPTSKTLVYPDNLRTEDNNPYGSNYVMFVLSDSSIPNSNGVISTLVNKNFKVVSDTVNAINNPSARNILKNVFSSLDALSAEWSAGVGQTSQSAAQKAAVAARAVKGIESPSIPVPMKKGFCNIVLYTPPALSTSYGANYETMSLTSVALDAVLPTIKKFAESKVGQMSPGQKAVYDSATNGALGKIANSGALSFASRLAINPKQELLFKGVDFRTFQFNYVFAPKNEKENNTVQEIIRQFKGNMLPELTAGTLMYKYPAEFDIYYYYDAKLNNNVHQHTTCVLEKVTINYAPAGQFSTFADGAPNVINMTLEFKELAQLDKESVLNGGY